MGAHIVLADESGFQVIPNVVQTWAPQGQTPIHRHRQGKREKVSVISGISVSPKRHHLALYYLLFFDNIGQEEVVKFLQELLRHLHGPIIVLLDNSSTHQGQPLQNLLDPMRAFIWSTSLPMHRNSSPMKASGLWPNMNSPIAAQIIWRS